MTRGLLTLAEMARRKMQHGGAREGAGRKPEDGVTKSRLVRLLATPGDVRHWRAAAKRAEQSLSEWLRTIANREAGK